MTKVMPALVNLCDGYFYTSETQTGWDNYTIKADVNACMKICLGDCTTI